MVDIRKAVTDKLRRYMDDDGHIVIHFESDTYISLNPATPRAWRYSVMRTDVHADGTDTQTAMLDRPMWAPIPRPSHVINASLLRDECFHELAPNINCACYQLAAHLSLCLEEVTHAMLELWVLNYPEETVFFCDASHDACVLRGTRPQLLLCH